MTRVSTRGDGLPCEGEALAGKPPVAPDEALAGEPPVAPGGGVALGLMVFLGGMAIVYP